MIVIVTVIVVDDEDDQIHLEVVRQVIIKSYYYSSTFILFNNLASGTVGRNKPLNRSACRPKWKSDVPITENQLRRKREEYWDTGTFE
jgi:hypothetical protein